MRLALGPAVGTGPAFAAVAGGLDVFVRPWLGVGVAAQWSLPGLGDPRAVEDAVGFASAVARFRPTPGARLRAEVLGAAGASVIRFGSPGRHDELAPDLGVGAALGWPLPGHLELAAEAIAHLTFGERTTAARALPHPSTVLALVLRWGA